MRVHVIYMVDSTTHNDQFTCESVSRQINNYGVANIIFLGSPGVDAKGRKVLTAQYTHAEVIYTCED